MIYTFAVKTPYSSNSLSPYPINIDLPKKSVLLRTPQKQNVFSALVSRELDLMMANDLTIKFKKVCHCEVCRKEIINFALKKLTTISVSSEENIETKADKTYKTYRALIESAVRKGFRTVYKNAPVNCESNSKFNALAS